MSRSLKLALVVVLSMSLPAIAQRKMKGKKPLFIAENCISGNCKQGTGAATNEDGDLYFGDWVNGKPHGLGSIYFDLDNEQYEPGTFFNGEFKVGLVDGFGTFEFPGERRMTVRFNKSQDLAVFENMEHALPRKRHYVMDDPSQWAGWALRQEEFFENGPPDRLLIEMHKSWDESKCWSTTGHSGSIQIYFLIDTGCSQTSLTKNTIDYLIENGIRVTKTGSDWYDTACGLMEFSEYEIEHITIGGTTFKNLPIGEVGGDDNLLGMDILGSFGTIEFNQEHKSLVLE